MDTSRDTHTLTRNFYRRRTAKAADATAAPDLLANSVGWKSHRSQLGVFAMLTAFERLDWNGLSSILEIGCGYGQLGAFLRENKKFSGAYTGIDILPGRIKKARQLYGGDPGNTFIAGDFLRRPWRAARFDLVVVGGAISVNYDYPGMQGDISLRYAEEIIRQAVGLARRAVSVYFPSRLRDVAPAKGNDPDMVFYAPQQIEAMVREACGARLLDLVVRRGREFNDIKAAILVRLRE